LSKGFFGVAGVGFRNGLAGDPSDRIPGGVAGIHGKVLVDIYARAGYTEGCCRSIEKRRQRVKVLVIVAHGSRRPEANHQVETLCQKVWAAADNRFDRVACGFLQFAAPRVPDLIEELIEKGADTLVIFPFFMAAGGHIFRDIPMLVQEKQAAHPRVNFFITRPLGSLDGLETLILKEVSSC
jgi:sirohydrochlorin cobaltochelatase